MTNDQGNTGTGGPLSDTDTVSVTVLKNNTNQPPVNAVPAAQTTNRNTPLAFSATNGNRVSTFDQDAGVSPIQVTLDFTSGTGTLTAPATVGVTISGNGTAAVTLTGTQGATNSALAGLTFTPVTGSTTPVTLRITTNDQGNSGQGNAKSDVDTVVITISPNNVAPVNTVPAAQATPEDTALVFSTGNGNRISIADADAGTNSVQVALEVTNGTLTVAGTTGLTITGGANGTSTMTFTGTLTHINNALDGLRFDPSANSIGPANLTLTTNDLGNTGPGGAMTDVDSVAIAVMPVDDPPVNTVPAAQATAEDTPLAFTGSRLISIDDVDAGTATIQVTLGVTNGTLTLNGTTGVTFLDGTGTGDTTTTFTGTVAAINTALAGLSFSPTAGFSGSATLTITTNDLGNTGSGGPLGDVDTVNITVDPVNDPPVNIMPGAQTTAEDTARVFSAANGNAIFIADVDADPRPVRVTLTVTHGTLTLPSISGLSFTTGDGTADATMTFSGAIAAINAALNDLIYSPDAHFTGSASLTITTDDLGHTGSGGARTDTDSVAITVTPANDPPVNTVPGSRATNEDTALVFSGGTRISIGDIDADPGAVEVTLTAANGTVTLDGTAGLTFATGDGSADTVVSFQGTIADINAALDNLSFTGSAHYNGPASLTITTNDLGHMRSGGPRTDTDAISITVDAVDDPPVNILPAAQSTGESTILVFSGVNGNQVAVSDVDAGANPVLVTLGAINGALSLNGVAGLTFTVGDGAADATLTFTGTLAAINTALDGLSYNPTAGYSGLASLTITTNDQGFTGTGSPLEDADTLSITVVPVNDPPVNTVPATQTFDEDTVRIFSAANSNAIIISDPDASPGAAEVTLSAADGTLTLSSTTGLTFLRGDGTADPVLTFLGTRADINAALDGLGLTPTLNSYGPSFVVVSTNDLGDTGTGGPKFDIDYILLTINPVDDVPVNTVPVAQTTPEDAALVFSGASSNAVSIADVDAGAAVVEVSLNITNGTLTPTGIGGLSFTTGDGTGDASMTFRGTIAAINAALDGLGFDPATDFNGSSTLTITTNDLSNTGSGGPLADTDTVAITVDAVHDPPAGADKAVTTAEDTAYTFTAADFGFTDPGDAPPDALLAARIAALPAAGTLTNDGHAVSVGQFIAAADNNAGKLRFTPVPNANGTPYTSFTFQVQDDGGTANGGADLDPTPNTITVNVTPINDLPAAVNDTATTAEDTPLYPRRTEKSYNPLNARRLRMLVHCRVVRGKPWH